MDYYRFNLQRISFKDCWTLTRNWQVLILALCKILHLRLPAPEGFPYPHSLSDVLTDEQALPPAIRDQFAEGNEQLKPLGFVHDFDYMLDTSLMMDESAGRVLRHESGKAIAIVIAVRSLATHPPTESISFGYLSRLADGRLLVTSNQKRQLTGAPDIDGEVVHGASPTSLWQRHVQRIEAASRPIREIRTRQDAIALSEQNERISFDHHIARGVYVRMTDEEIAAIRAKRSPHAALEKPVEAARPATMNTDPSDEVIEAAVDENCIEAASMEAESVETTRTAYDVQILGELEELDKQTTTRQALFTILVISALLFVSAGAAWWSWRRTAILVPVLLFHEFGHYVAMRVMKYRNLKMFFIPLMGAAVTGRKFNVPGWKQVLVSLAGPVPGILLGGVVGVVGLILAKEWLLEVSFWLLLLNAFNLLPFLPLDGGWVLHAVLFCRHMVLDVAFRGVAVAILLAGHLFLDSWVLLGLALLVGMVIPAVIRINRIARRMIERGVPRGSPDDQHIPEETAIAIGRELRAVWGKNKVPVKTLAGLVPQVFERMNARPPAAVASVGLLALHGASFVGAVFVAGVYYFLGYGQGGPFWDPEGPFAYQMPEPANTVVYDCGEPNTASGCGDIAGPLENWHTLIATFPDSGKARTAFAQITGDLPEGAGARSLGDTVMLRLRSHGEERRRWTKEFEALSANVLSENVPGSYESLTAYFSFVAPTEELAERIEAELNIYRHAFAQMTAPWHPDHLVTEPGNGDRFFARHTYALLTQALYDDDSMWLGSAAVALRRGSPDDMERHMKDERQAAIERLEDQGVALDPEVVRLFELVNTSTPNLYDQPELDELNEYLGYHEFDPSYLLNAEKGRYTSVFAEVTRDGATIRVWSMNFTHTFDGVDAFLRWLCALDCTDIHYGFSVED